MCAAGQIYYIYPSYFEDHGVYSAQCLKELTSARPIFRHIPHQARKKTLRSKGDRAAADPIKGSAALCRLRCRSACGHSATFLHRGIPLAHTQGNAKGERGASPRRSVSAQYHGTKKETYRRVCRAVPLHLVVL